MLISASARLFSVFSSMKYELCALKPIIPSTLSCTVISSYAFTANIIYVRDTIFCLSCSLSAQLTWRKNSLFHPYCLKNFEIWWLVYQLVIRTHSALFFGFSSIKYMLCALKPFNQSMIYCHQFLCIHARPTSFF
jgi:hypothetical protein